MTKQNPDILCKACREFDKTFENGNVRMDFLVVCNHDELIESVKEQIEKNEKTIKKYAGVLPDYPLNMKSTQYPEG